MTSTVTISDARATLPAIVARVMAGEEITLTRHGQPVAVVVRPDTLRSRRADAVLAMAAQIGDLIERSRSAPLPESTMSTERAEELIADIPRRARSPIAATMDAFDSDVLIYAAAAGHPIGRRVKAMLERVDDPPTRAGLGSVLLVPEVLSKPLRQRAEREIAALSALLGRLDLLPTDRATAELAAALGASYRLRAADAVHLATAVRAGADRFITNNTRDFPTSITEIDVTYPGELPDPG